MPRKFVSPGVFTQELDQSYLAQGVGAIGAAVVGQTLKGPAFVPTVVTDFNEFVAKFGDVDPSLQLPYAAKNYLKNGNSLTVVRVLGNRDGADAATKPNGANLLTYGITGTLSASVGSQASAVLATFAVPQGTTATISGTGAGSTFTYNFTGSWGNYAGTASFNPTSADYIGKVFNANPKKVATYGHFLYKNFQWAHEGKLAATGSTGFGVTVAGGAQNLTVVGTTSASFNKDFTTSRSPVIKSQAFGNQTYDLFYFETRSAGQASTTDIKVSIVNIMPSVNPTIDPYGTFDIIVRAWSDVDNRMVQLESFSGCNLNPKSANYVARRIGDQKLTWDSVNRKNTVSGVYKNASKYVRIEMSSADYDETALPWGHAGYPEDTVAGGTIPEVPYVMNNLDSAGNVESGNIWGIDTTQSNVSDRLKLVLGTGATGAAFSLASVTSSLVSGTTVCVYDKNYAGTTPTAASTTNSTVAPARNGFTLAMYGGFDGWNPVLAPVVTEGATLHTETSYKAAIDTISNPDEIDLNLLAIPGVTDSTVTDYGRSMCNARGDCMMIMDVDGTSVSDVIGRINSRGIDDNYAACYYPDLRYADTANGVLVQVKPSVAMLGAYAYNDRVGQPYFAPAGLNRGGLSQFGIVDTVDRLTFQDRNDLYDARINPIATFPNEGIVAFGQKTLQVRPSALDRVNVRRLLIYAKKTIASAARYLLFEPNNPNTWQRFLNTVNPILDEVRMQQGLERFKVVMDSTVNTPDLVDRNVMTGKIFLQPTKAAEYIDLSFIITASGVSFGE